MLSYFQKGTGRSDTLIVTTNCCTILFSVLKFSSVALPIQPGLRSQRTCYTSARMGVSLHKRTIDHTRFFINKMCICKYTYGSQLNGFQIPSAHSAHVQCNASSQQFNQHRSKITVFTCSRLCRFDVA